MLAQRGPEVETQREVKTVAGAQDVPTPLRSYHLDYRPIVDRRTRFEAMARVRKFEDLLDLKNEPRKLDELDRNVSEGAEAVFAIDDDTGRDVAVMVHRLKTQTLEDRTLSIDMVALRVVEPHARQMGIGKRFTQDTIERYDKQGIELDGFSGRTPNPYIVLGYKRLPEIGLFYPIDRLYNPELGRFMVALLLPDVVGVNFRTGRCEQAYPPGENRLFPPIDPKKDREAFDIYKRMTDSEKKGGLGINLAEGDGMRYLAMIKKPTRGRVRWSVLPLVLPNAV